MLSLWKEFFLAVPSQKSHPSLQLIRDRRQSAASLDCVGGKIQKCLRHIYVLKIRPLLITYQFESFWRDVLERCLWNICESDQIKHFSRLSPLWFIKVGLSSEGIFTLVRSFKKRTKLIQSNLQLLWTVGAKIQKCLYL